MGSDENLPWMVEGDGLRCASDVLIVIVGEEQTLKTVDAAIAEKRTLKVLEVP